jgi:protein gp37
MAEYLNDEDLGHDLDDSARRLDLKIPFKWPLPNVWLGTTIENQKEADKRIYHLIKCPAAVRFVSCEPLVGPIDLTKVRRADVETLPNYRYDCLRAGTWTSGFYPGEFVNHSDVCDEVIHWVIAGGESGPKAEPSHPDWFRSLRDQCEAAEVPFFFKQWGEWCPIGQIQNDESVRGFTSYKVFDTETCSHRVGKNAAGNFLDGKEWNKFPKGRNEVQNG